MRELYARNRLNKSLIKNKREVTQVEQLSGVLEQENECNNWLLSCFQGHTVQLEAEKLSEEQLLLASIVVSAVSDCATIDAL
jgi:hypothetical protein